MDLGKKEKLFSSLENREEKEKLFLRFLKSRGERDMKISFSRAREKNLNHFSSRISRDRDSCQCLGVTVVRSSLDIITHQGHISQVSLNDQ